MYIDALLLFSDDQDLTASAVSTNVVDAVVDGNIGVGEPMSVVVALPEGTDGGDADETYSVILQSSIDEAFTAPIDLVSVDIPRGLAAGSKAVVPVPADGRASQYFRLSYVLGGTTPAAKFKSFLTMSSMIQNEYVYQDGFDIAE